MLRAPPRRTPEAASVRPTLEFPPPYPHSHDAPEKRLVDQEFRLHRADRAEEHDPLPQLGFAVLDQLGRGKRGEPMPLTRTHPLDQAPVEVDADIADVARADVMRPGVRRRE